MSTTKFLHFLLKKIRNAQVFAFSISRSNATIPVTLRTVIERMGVDNSVRSFTVPFGATINMDGTVIMQSLAMVFTQVGLALEGIGLILGVDHILDMVRTAVNVSGDAVVSTVVAKGEGKLNIDVFNDPEAGAFDTADVHIDADVERDMAVAIQETHDK